jgi:hypothetical protein
VGRKPSCSYTCHLWTPFCSPPPSPHQAQVKYSHLEDDSDVLTQRIHILEGKLEGDRIGVKVGTVLCSRVGGDPAQDGPCPGRKTTSPCWIKMLPTVLLLDHPRPTRSSFLPDFSGHQIPPTPISLLLSSPFSLLPAQHQPFILHTT